MKIGNLEVYGVIYKITNKINGKVYIGQTTNEKGFDGRYSYKGSGIERIYNYHRKLRDNEFPYNTHLLNAFEKYGLDNFDLLYCMDFAFSKKELDIKEQTFIKVYDSYKNGYNRNLGGEGNKGRMALKAGDSPSSKSVIQISLSGDIIKKWSSIIEASQSLNICKSTITSTCKGNRKSAGGYMWVYEDEYNSDFKYVYNNTIGDYNKIKVVCLSLTGQFVAVFTSLSEASDFAKGSDVSKITSCCKGERKSNGGYMWVYEDEYCDKNEYIYNVSNCGEKKSVVQLSKTGDYIANFDSISQASSLMKISSSKITSTCKGNRKSAGGYMWVYEDEYCDKNEYIYKREIKRTRVFMCDLEGEVISMFDSLTQAEDITGISFKSISNCLRGKSKSAGGYVWVREEEYNSNKNYKVKRNDRKAILMLDLETNEIISEFESMAEAERKTNIKAKNISYNITRSGITGGYKWFYKDENKEVV